MKTETLIQDFRATESRPEAYYIGAAQRFTDWMELGAYYSVFYREADDKDGEGLQAAGRDPFQAWQKDLALSARFDLSEYALFKLEGHLIDGAAQVLSTDNPGGLEDDWFLFAAKVTFSF